MRGRVLDAVFQHPSQPYLTVKTLDQLGCCAVSTQPSALILKLNTYLTNCEIRHDMFLLIAMALESFPVV